MSRRALHHVSVRDGQLAVDHDAEAHVDRHAASARRAEVLMGMTGAVVEAARFDLCLREIAECGERPTRHPETVVEAHAPLIQLDRLVESGTLVGGSQVDHCAQRALQHGLAGGVADPVRDRHPLAEVMLGLVVAPHPRAAARHGVEGPQLELAVAEGAALLRRLTSVAESRGGIVAHMFQPAACQEQLDHHPAADLLDQRVGPSEELTGEHPLALIDGRASLLDEHLGQEMRVTQLLGVRRCDGELLGSCSVISGALQCVGQRDTRPRGLGRVVRADPCSQTERPHVERRRSAESPVATALAAARSRTMAAARWSPAWNKCSANGPRCSTSRAAARVCNHEAASPCRRRRSCSRTVS